MKKIMLSLLLLTATLFAENVYSLTLNEKTDSVYPKLMASLAKNHLMVVSEINILEKFKKAGLPAKFGKEFNTNNLTAIRAIIACNGYFGNYIANSDPKMMALCPVRLTVLENNGKTMIVFVKPTTVSADSKAANMVAKLEAKVISAIEAIK
jgi:uncharacterized protein (DUF302 family)